MLKEATTIDTLKEIDFWINLSSNVFALVASGIAVYIFFFQRDKISSALNFVLNYSYQLTISDLKYKIERLNDYNTNDPASKEEVINILHEIEGQINGSKILKEQMKEQLKKVVSLIKNSATLTEPKKRSVVSELRESLRHIDASNIGSIMNVKK